MIVFRLELAISYSCSSLKFGLRQPHDSRPGFMLYVIVTTNSFLKYLYMHLEVGISLNSNSHIYTNIYIHRDSAKKLCIWSICLLSEVYNLQVTLMTCCLPGVCIVPCNIECQNAENLKPKTTTQKNKSDNLQMPLAMCT